MTFRNDINDIKIYLDRLNGAFDGVVEWVFERGALHQFPRVVHYVGKENGGPGWEDTYQNMLIDRILASSGMKRESDEIFFCSRDGSRWYHTKEEWRMLAYKQKLVPLHANTTEITLPLLGAPIEDGVVFFSNDFFHTIGFAPVNGRQRDLVDTVQYLTALCNGECLDLSIPTEGGTIRTPSIWQKIRRLLSFY